MPLSYPTIMPGLRGPSEEVQGLVYFGRMLDTIHLQASERLARVAGKRCAQGFRRALLPIFGN